jgi:crotonobetainyl-CoA:carnitine CoA-transferase CaiB-like acyl-CoA transferase
MPLLVGFHVAQLGHGLAAAASGRLFTDTGATVSVVGKPQTRPLDHYMMRGKTPADRATALANADLIIAEGGPAALLAQGNDLSSLRALNAAAAIVLISPFGQTGPRADEPATDLTVGEYCSAVLTKCLSICLRGWPQDRV